MFTPVPRTFKDAAGNPFTKHEANVDEPVSPATESAGASFEVHYTPKGTAEVVKAGIVAGPTGRVRVDRSTNGGGVWGSLASPGAAVGGTAGVEQVWLLRYVGLPWAGDDADVSTLAIAVTAPGAEAGWLD